jgi:hypothetical protein
MARIAFLVDIEQGHIFSTFSLARKLKMRGLEIFYLGVADVEEMIRKQGMEFRPLLQDLMPLGSVAKLRAEYLKDQQRHEKILFYIKPMLQGTMLDSIFDNLMSYLHNPQTANGAGILGHVFGGNESTVANNLAQATGLDQNSASGVLQTLAPLVMGAVGQTQQQNSLDASDLSNLLNSQQQQANENAPGVMSMLGSMLDRNQDGSAMDDLQRMAARFLK